MNYYQHLIFGASIAGVVQYEHIVQPNLAVGIGLYYASEIVGSLLPDIDHPSSYFGFRLWGRYIKKDLRSSIAKKTHRKLTHSLVFLIGVLLFVWYVSHNLILVQGMFIGIFSHFIGDMLTPMGVPLLYPFKKKFKIFPLIKSGRR